MNHAVLERIKAAGINPAALLSLDNIGAMEVGPSLAPARPALDPARLGKITGSRFGDVKYGRNGKGWAAVTDTLLADLVFEHATLQSASRFSGSAATDWGHEHEPAALSEYERRTGQKVARNKFQKMQGAKLIGCTPDGIGPGLAVECKCPYNPKNHIQTLLSNAVPTEYVDQVNGHMLVSGAQVCHFVTFDPRYLPQRPALSFHLIEVERDEHQIKELKDRLLDFEDYLLKTLERLGIEPIF